MVSRIKIPAAIAFGALLGAACSVSLGDKLRYSCTTDTDCGGDGFHCTVVAAVSFCCKTSGTEVCDGLDNDCDGVVDNGFDLKNDSANCGACGKACPSGQICSAGACLVHATNCSDGNDHCADAACNLQPCGPGCACKQLKKAETSCTDGQDNDGDNLLDCADPDCEGQSCGDGCTCKAGGKTESKCADFHDNDLDTKIDCADEDCVGQSCGTGCACAAGGGKKETLCSDGADNDGDSLNDCADPDCDSSVCLRFSNGGGSYQCNSGVCNCHGGSGVPESSPALCSDGVDNDCNGKTDCAESSCAGKSCNLDGGTGTCSSGTCQ